MPELPEMQALAERLEARLSGRRLSAWQAIGFSALKTVDPSPDDLLGEAVQSVTRRGKYVVVGFEHDYRLLLHLAQSGRLDIEEPPKETRPRGGVMRLVFDATVGVLMREYGHERNAAWWVLGANNDGPLEGLGPDADEQAFVDAILNGDSTRHLHTLLRDQHFAAGIGRGYVDDALNRAGLSPFVSLRSLNAAQRRELLDAIETTLAEALEHERTRSGGLSAARLGERFAVHNRAGEPCPRCGGPLARVSYASHEVAYCPKCQTNGRVLADRRLSRLLR